MLGGSEQRVQVADNPMQLRAILNHSDDESSRSGHHVERQ
jgi:hypothetical protein